MLHVRKERSALKASMYVITAFVIISLTVGLLMNGIHANSLSATGQRINQYYSSTETYTSPVPVFHSTVTSTSRVAEFPSNVNVFFVFVVALVGVAVMIAMKRRKVVGRYVG